MKSHAEKGPMLQEMAALTAERDKWKADADACRASAANERDQVSAQMNRLREERDTLKARVKVAVDIIRLLDQTTNICPYCGGTAHAPDCRLAKWLKEVEGK